ncbi:hypothetical protein B0I35DRAFT_444061 [Stachybotrys elegans]|uniref:Secreted protein n=1 Tax=Stachybotrys elegans TaxID=80388 RepID=A0A8K0SKH7_9HYPO|nr:hypothetical protein B0I35DRAFT_444061 [Stachybotrys elegans]
MARHRSCGPPGAGMKMSLGCFLVLVQMRPISTQKTTEGAGRCLRGLLGIHERFWLSWPLPGCISIRARPVLMQRIAKVKRRCGGPLRMGMRLLSISFLPQASLISMQRVLCSMRRRYWVPFGMDMRLSLDSFLLQTRSMSMQRVITV